MDERQSGQQGLPATLDIKTIRLDESAIKAAQEALRLSKEKTKETKKASISSGSTTK